MSATHTSHYTPNAADAAAATRSLWTWYVFKPLPFVGVMAFFAILTAMLVFASYIPLWVILTSVGLAIPISLALLLLFVAPMTGRRLFRQTSHLSGEVNIEWGEDGISLFTERGSSSFGWSDFYRWGLSKRHLMLFLGEAASIMIPREALGDGEATALDGLRRAGVRKY